jgi:hypothetical protein
MSIIGNVMNSCGLSEKDAKEEYEAAIANAADNYACDTIVNGRSGFSALSDAVDEVLSDLGIECDYEVSVAEAITNYLASHPDVEERAKRLKEQEDEERRWEQEWREHSAKGEVLAVVHAERSEHTGGLVPDYRYELDEAVKWTPQKYCIFVNKDYIYPWVLRSELDRLGYWYAKPENERREEKEVLA